MHPKTTPAKARGITSNLGTLEGVHSWAPAMADLTGQPFTVAGPARTVTYYPDGTRTVTRRAQRAVV